MDMDIPLILGDIRPNAEWGWLGEDKSDYNFLDWRDQLQSKPALQEIIDAWPATQKTYFTDVATAEAEKATLITNLRAGTVDLATIQDKLADLLEG